MVKEPWEEHLRSFIKDFVRGLIRNSRSNLKRIGARTMGLPKELHKDFYLRCITSPTISFVRSFTGSFEGSLTRSFTTSLVRSLIGSCIRNFCKEPYKEPYEEFKAVC